MRNMASRDLTLNERFEKSQKTSIFSKSDFLPVGTLHDLLTRQEIKNQMVEEGLESECTDEFLEFVSNHAKKVFAILVYQGLVRYASTLLKYKFKDKHLPMLKSTQITSFNLLADDEALKWFQGWGRNDPLLFQRGQWFFLAPEFTDKSIMEQPHDKCPLPIIDLEVGASRGGSFSILYKGKILKDHVSWLKEDQEIAIKELNDKNITEKAYEIEVDALGLTRRLNHDHLVKFVAGFQQRQKSYLIFQWVSGGDLNAFWKENEPVRYSEYFGWALSQFHGLACGLRELHKQNCRHTDLKPNNILRVERQDSPGHFQIADLGLAKVHVLPTSLRRVSTTNIAGTGRYQPPEEMETWRKGTRSRSYDLWSMGCILLELIVWLLLGKEGWERFNESFEGPFYSLEGSSPIDPVVDRWISYLRGTYLGDSDDMVCVSQALRDLLDHVCTRLLVKDLRQGEDGGPIDGDVNLLPDHTDESIPTVIVTRPTFKPAEPETSRADIDELCGNMEEICHNTNTPDYLLEKSTAGIIGTFTLPLISEPLSARFRAGRQLQIADTQNPYAVLPLSDKWDTINDNVFARDFFRNLTSDLVSGVLPDASSPLLDTPELCNRCLDTTTGIFSEFSVNRQQANEGSETCKLCEILSAQNWGDPSGDSDTEPPKIVRSDSSLELTQNGSTETVCSIVIGPGPSNAPMHIQRGFPYLPPPGSKIQALLFNHWIEDCDDTSRHDCCKPGGLPKNLRAPTRLIHVGDLDSHEFTIKLDCYPDRREDKKYTILSHPWGDRSKHPRYCTTIKNCDKFEEVITFDDMPRNFQDAVTVTRSLNVQYLWIDSLCIMQRYESDDKSESDDGDFYEECKFMEDYYGGAYCTIAATSATGSSDGFLNPRPRNGSQTRQRHCYELKTGMGSEPEIESKFYLCSPIDNFAADVDKSHMSSRGWVFQERALSRRTLHFAETQVYFECGQGIRCETMTKLFNRKSSFLSDPLFPKAAKEYKQGMQIEFFKEIFSRYSSLKFDPEHEDDRAWALKGLESRLSREYSVPAGHGVLGGKFLGRSLLWQKAKESLRAIHFRKGNPIPSWSWMGVMGSIAYLDAPYGQVKWNSPEIDSPLKYEPGSKVTVIGELCAVARGLSKNLKWPKLVFDREIKTPDIENLKCVIIGSDKQNLAEPDQNYYVLLVTATDNTQSRSSYRREGVAVLSTDDIMDLDKSNLGKVSII